MPQGPGWMPIHNGWLRLVEFEQWGDRIETRRVVGQRCDKLQGGGHRHAGSPHMRVDTDPEGIRHVGDFLALGGESAPFLCDSSFGACAAPAPMIYSSQLLPDVPGGGC